MQAQTTAPPDTVLLTFEQYLQQVYAYHPLARRANLQRDEADAYLLKARGGFDPKIGTQWDYKRFKETDYFNIFNAYLKVPIWSEIAIEGGYDYANGGYLGNERTLPEAGQAYLGVSVPLLKGLWTSERRLTLQRTQLMVDASEAEVQTALNDLLYKASKAYWEWVKAYSELQVIIEALATSNDQLDAVRASYSVGDKPAIDTLKAYIQTQERQVLLANSLVDVDNHRRLISAYLWNEEQQPVVLASTVFPVLIQRFSSVPFEANVLENSLTQLSNHPDLVLYDYKLQDLALERRLNANQLLPQLDFKYNFLAYSDVNFFAGGGVPLFENYKLGVKFNMPLFLRKERATLAITDLKLRATRYDLDNKQRDLRVKLENYFNQVQIFAAQTATLEQMVNNYARLLEAEHIKLDLGESSVFLVNTRENQLLDARRKLIKQQAEYLKARTAFFWASATLSTNIN